MIPWIASLATICASVSIPLAIHVRFWRLGELRRETEYQAEQRSYEAKFRACKDLVPSITRAVKQSQTAKKDLAEVLSDKKGTFYDDLSKIVEEYRIKIFEPFHTIDRMEGRLSHSWHALGLGGLLVALIAVIAAWYDPSIPIKDLQGTVVDVQGILTWGLALGIIVLVSGLRSLLRYSNLRTQFYRNYELDPETKARIERIYRVHQT